MKVPPADLHGFEVTRLVPGDLEIAIAPPEIDDCGEPQIAADVARCDALCKRAQAQASQFNRPFADLRTQAFNNSVAVSAYETSLAGFNGQLAGFQQDLAIYESELAGRTYTTTALNDEADQLNQTRAALVGVRINLTSSFDDLMREARDEAKGKAALLDSIQNLIDDLSKELKAFICMDCSRLRPLIERLKSLRRDVNSIRVAYPSGLPPGIPWVPVLPSPPWSGIQGIPGAPRGHLTSKVRVLITGTPSLTGIPKLIYAGQVFPNTVPVEGAPRVCVGQVWWLYRITVSGLPLVLKQVFEGTRGPTFQFLFQKNPAPTVEIDGGLDATDILVSDDRTRVYFTLSRLGATASVTHANITITDATGTVIKVHSNDPTDDPSPSLTFETDIAKGLAGLLASLGFIAVDSFFEHLKADPQVQLSDLGKAMSGYTNIFARIARSMFDRAEDQADEWAKNHINELLDVLPRQGEIMPSGGAISHLMPDVPAWYDVLSTAQMSGSRGYTGQFADHPNMVLDRIGVWGEALGISGL